jgi:hypothetical protein
MRPAESFGKPHWSSAGIRKTAHDVMENAMDGGS